MSTPNSGGRNGRSFWVPLIVGIAIGALALGLVFNLGRWAVAGMGQASRGPASAGQIESGPHGGMPPSLEGRGPHDGGPHHEGRGERGPHGRGSWFPMSMFWPVIPFNPLGLLLLVGLGTLLLFRRRQVVAAANAPPATTVPVSSEGSETDPETGNTQRL